MLVCKELHRLLDSLQRQVAPNAPHFYLQHVCEQLLTERNWSSTTYSYMTRSCKYRTVASLVVWRTTSLFSQPSESITPTCASSPAVTCLLTASDLCYWSSTIRSNIQAHVHAGLWQALVCGETEKYCFFTAIRVKHSHMRIPSDTSTKDSLTRCKHQT